MPFKVQQLIERRRQLVTATPDETLQSALERMIEHSFSQLPVVDDENRPLGMVTSDSIVRALEMFGVTVDKLTVGSAMDKADERRADEDLFDLLDDLRDAYAVLIVDGRRHLIGIVTSYDTTEYFRWRDEDRMLVEDIEAGLKDQIRAAVPPAGGQDDGATLQQTIDEITDSRQESRKQFEKALKHYLELQKAGAYDTEVAQKVFTAHFGAKPAAPKDLDQLTFYEYSELLLHRRLWPRVNSVLHVERDALRKILDVVRETRNTLMHFRGDINAMQHEQVHFLADWLARLQGKAEREIYVPVAVPAVGNTLIAEERAEYTATAPDSEAAPADEVPVESDGKYGPLAGWLQSRPSETDRVPLRFGQIEAIINDKLPPSALKHRVWWSSDAASSSEPREWVDAGWRVAAFDAEEGQVTFVRVRERQSDYIRFFNALLADLRKSAPFDVRTAAPDGHSWYVVAGLPEHEKRAGTAGYSFARGKRFRVEFYIGYGDHARNKQIFDALRARREAIEAEFGESLSWERIDERRASRIAVYRDYSIADPEEKLSKLRAWAVDAMIRFYAVMDKHVSDVVKSIQA